MNLYEWLGQPGGIIGPAIGNPALYTTPGALQPWEYDHVLRVAFQNLAFASDPTARQQLVANIKAAGGLLPTDDTAYWADPARTPAEIEHLITEAGRRLATIPASSTQPVGTTPTPGLVDPGKGVTDVAPVKVGSSTIPQGGRVVIVDAPVGSDAAKLFYIAYLWRGVEAVFRVGDEARFNELFGSLSSFASITTLDQGSFDAAGFIEAGLIDQELGATESFGSRAEREVRELGFEDLPSWLAGSPDALHIVATAAAQSWSSGRLWTSLEPTAAFKTRFGTALPTYLQQGMTIGEAVAQITADENGLRTALRPWLAGDEASTTQFLQEMLNQGWTPGSAAQVLEQAEVLRRDPDTFVLSNMILAEHDLPTLDEVGFLNALNGFGPQDTIEALNTATAGRALAESGIDIADEDVNLLMELVDSSDRLLTVDSWRSLAQELSFNLIRFNTELDQGKLGLVEEDLMAAAFGRASPTGKTSGEVVGLLARLERDRRAASQGLPGSTGFLDEQGRLRIAGLAGL